MEMGIGQRPKVTLLFSTLVFAHGLEAQSLGGGPHLQMCGSVNEEIKESAEETKSDRKMN